MKICVIGTGYVGLIVCTCLTNMGNNVVCVDNNEEKISLLEKGIIPIYEPGLEELIKNPIKDNVIFDGRNQYNPLKLKELDINYICIGL